ncbi:VWA domain-containing protein [Ruegeria arenilitoris]|uniref:VWA domain-containing protein n=1 Tax=Ruegeria arenilitoris TaxID=1173585 RepID=UPI0014806BB1|nr:VWA domain-containing protein [Ruegeria arenilitoris]
MRVNAALEEAGDIWSALARYADILDDAQSLKTHIQEKIRVWKQEAGDIVEAESPFGDHERAFDEWRQLPSKKRKLRSVRKSAVRDYLELCKAVGQPGNEAYWKLLYTARKPKGALGEALGKQLVSTQQLTFEWQKTLDRARSDWELARIAELRSELIRRIAELLEMFQKLKTSLEVLGLDSGVLFNLSGGSLSPQDIEEFRRWAQYFAEDEGVRSLCDLLGKMRQLESSERIERAKVSITVEVQQPDVNSKEEIVGVRLGRDLEHALPSELALLADSETELLFDIKYLEARLMCFDMQGIQTSSQTVETEQDIQTIEKEQLGPMILCVDTSGSMSGTPETIAKAVTLFMATRAREQKRPCYIVNFSTGIEVFNMSEGLQLDRLMDFLKMSFHGGTDVAPALLHSLEVMENKTYENADVLVISDFIMASLPDHVSKKICEQRAKGNRFNSLIVDRSFMSRRLESLFDHEWVFDPVSSGIHELIGFQRRISEQVV